MDIEELKFWVNVNIGDGCWLWKGSRRGPKCSNRYGMYRGRTAHRVAYEFSRGPVPDGLHVHHDCYNALCVKPSHLSVGTHAQKCREMGLLGRMNTSDRRGAKNTFSKLTTHQVREIRRLYAEEEFLQRELAVMFKTTQQHIGSIVRRESWAHVL